MSSVLDADRQSDPDGMGWRFATIRAAMSTVCLAARRWLESAGGRFGEFEGSDLGSTGWSADCDVTYAL